MKRLFRTVPAFGVPGSVLFAAGGLVLTMMFLLVTAGVTVADTTGTLLHDEAMDAAEAGQAAYNAQGQATAEGFSGSEYIHTTAYVDNAVNGIVQMDTGGLPAVHLNTPQVTINAAGQVQVTLTGNFVDTVVSKAFSTFVPSNPSATFPISITGTGFAE